MSDKKPSGLALAGRQLLNMTMPLIAIVAILLVIWLLKVIGVIG